MTRFIVTELEGLLQPSRGGGKKPGLSCMVIDTAWNHRVAATFRSEEKNGGPTTRDGARQKIREAAAARANELNALDVADAA